MSTTRPIANHTTRHKVASSHTLMRSAVKKPSHGLKRKLKVSLALDINTPHHISLESNEHTVQAHPKKTVHIKKSAKIRHFINIANHTAPVPPIYTNMTSEPLVIEPTNNHSSLSTKPAPVKSSLDLILERGLDRATSHLEPRAPKVKKKKSRHLNTLGITSIVALVLTVATLLSTNTI